MAVHRSSPHLAKHTLSLEQQDMAQTWVMQEEEEEEEEEEEQPSSGGDFSDDSSLIRIRV